MGDHRAVSAHRPYLLLASLLSITACDSSARTGANIVAPAAADGQSLAYESCQSTADCESELRCIDGTCLSAQRSRLGDYYAALGRRLLTDPAASSRAYNLAATQYEQEKLSPPMDLLCEQGIALAAGREDVQLAEAGARILHKCVLGVPPGSHLARAAMDALASLSEVGLEAELLTRSETADLYLTGEAMRPDTESLQLSISGDDKNKRRSYTGLLEALQTPDARTQFVGCWESNYKLTKNEELQIVLDLSYMFLLDEDDESRDRAVLKLSPVNPSDPQLEPAQRCVEAAASAIADEYVKGVREDTRWKLSLQLRVGP